MNQFFRRVLFCFTVIFSLVSSAGLWADDLASSSDNNPAPVLTPVNSVATIVPADNESPVMDEVVITANRLDTPANEIPNSVTVITAQELEQKQAGTVLDALQSVPGVELAQTGQPGSTASLYTRGSGDGNTLVMIDGIPLNDPLSTSRSYDFLDQLSLDDVSRIEVVRGPQSTLYGSNAMAGVVNIITKNGVGPASGSALFGGGSYGTFFEQATAQGGDSKTNYLLSASDFSTAGFPVADKTMGNVFNNPDDNISSVLKLGVTPTNNFKEDLLVRYNQSRTSFDDGAGTPITNGVTFSMDDPNAWANQNQFLVGSKTQWTLGDWTQLLTISFVDDYRDQTDMADLDYVNSSSYHLTFDGQTAQVIWQNDLKLSKEETLVFGLQGYQEWGNQTSDYGVTTTPTLDNQRVGSSFLESQTNIEDRLFINLGGRVDDYSTYGTHGTYQGGVAYLLPELETKLKATYGTGLLAPTLYQLYAPVTMGGNVALQPETNTGYDFGFEQPVGKKFVVFGATYFHNDFDDLISYVGPFFGGQYQNNGDFQTQGVEAFLDFKGIEGLVVRGSYTYTDILTDIPATESDSPLLRKPTDQAGLDVDYQSGPVEAGVSVNYEDARSDVYFQPVFPYGTIPVTLSDYFLVNLRASYQLDERVKLFARVDNLFNQFYEEVYGYGTPGLSAYGGTKVSF